ncbi:unnamed protein product [Blepharisma stoltei]|uniref:Telomeric single stranded DNA binding POT1/Cdc13 domain-containing protein n=1 Tax=Blepharisma stoltei TaxID=1481888 RepID=A0AAU9JI10_9CILI|nr:unnamed protein product [Blepharisma stoltei]
MSLKNLQAGFIKQTISAKIESTSNLHEQLMRIAIKDSNGSKANIILEGELFAKCFERIRKDTSIKVSDFVISTDYSQVSQYFPDFIHGPNITNHGSDFQWFIHITDGQIPSLELSYKSNTLQIDEHTNLNKISIEDLYKVKIPHFDPKSPKFCNLKYIIEHSNESGFYANCYGTILHSTSSYNISHIKDFIAMIQITDLSIYPESIDVTIFHHSPREMIKIRALGDIVYLHQCQFRCKNGEVSGRLSAGRSSSKWFVFDLENSHSNPYGSYKSIFKPDKDHEIIMKNVREWTIGTFANNNPLGRNSKRLSMINKNEEANIVFRVYGIYKMGIRENSPSALVGYDQASICQAIIQKSEENAYKYIKNSDTMQITNAIFENGRIFLTKQSDILIIPEFMNSNKIPLIPEKSKELNAILKGYMPSYQIIKRSQINPSLYSFPMYSYERLKHIDMNAKCRVQGFIIKILPENPWEAEGMYCSTCKAKTCFQFCQCGDETEIKCKFEIFLWDGSENVKSVIRLILNEEDCSQFIGSMGWENLKKLLLSYESLFEFGIEVAPDGFRIIDTKIISN